MAGPPLLFALVVRDDDTVKTPDDLKGRKVGVSTVGSVTSWIVSEVSRQKGWGFDGIDPGRRSAMTQARIAALKTKSLDAAIVNLAVALNYVQRGDGRILLRFGDLLKDFHVHVIFATDKAIASRPEALLRLPRGLVRDHRVHAREQGRDRRRSPKTIMEHRRRDDRGSIYDELMPMFSNTGRFDPKALAVLSRSFVEMKTLPAEPDMTQALHRSIPAEELTHG